MTKTKAIKKQEKIIRELHQQLKTKEFNKICKAIELEYFIATK